MKTIQKLLLMASLSASLFADPCILNSNGEITDVGNVGNGGNTDCRLTPESYSIKLFKVALCSEAPDLMSRARYDNLGEGYQVDLSSCDAVVFENPAGKSMSIKLGESTTLNSRGIPKIEGKTYTHYVIIIGPELGVKASAKFANTMNDGANGSGQYCWTINNTVSQLVMEPNGNNGADIWDTLPLVSTRCGTSAGAPGTFTLKGDSFGDMVDSDEEEVNMRVVSVDDSYTVHTNSANNTKLVLFYPLNSSINLESVSRMNIDFKVSNAVEAVIWNNNGSNYSLLKVGPFSFDIQAQ